MAATPGAQLSQPPVTLVNTMNGFTQKYFQPILADNIFKPSPTYWRLTRLGKKVDGGGALVWTGITAEELTGGSYWGTQTLDTSITDSGSPFELQWKFYQQAISIPVTDLLMNAGRGKVLDLVKGKEEIAMGSLMQKLARGVYAVSPQNTTIDIDALPSALAASGTYAANTISATTGWKSNGTSGPSSPSAIGLASMQTDYGAATFGNEEPDTFITTQAGFNAFWGLLTPNQRYFDEETTRAGFKNHLMFNNAVCLHDQFTPSGEWYFLTSKYIKPVFNEEDYFRVDPFLQPTNQRVIVSHIWLQLNIQLLTLRQHSRATGLTNA